jgi:hypothetical protein
MPMPDREASIRTTRPPPINPDVMLAALTAAIKNKAPLKDVEAHLSELQRQPSPDVVKHAAALHQLAQQDPRNQKALDRALADLTKAVQATGRG